MFDDRSMSRVAPTASRMVANKIFDLLVGSQMNHEIVTDTKCRGTVRTEIESRVTFCHIQQFINILEDNEMMGSVLLTMRIA